MGCARLEPLTVPRRVVLPLMTHPSDLTSQTDRPADFWLRTAQWMALGPRGTPGKENQDCIKPFNE